MQMQHMKLDIVSSQPIAPGKLQGGFLMAESAGKRPGGPGGYFNPAGKLAVMPLASFGWR